MAVPLTPCLTHHRIRSVALCALLCLGVTEVSAQQNAPLRFRHPEHIPQPQLDALTVEFASRQYELVGEPPAQADAVETESLSITETDLAEHPALMIQRFNSNGALERSIRVEGTLEAIDPRALAIAAGSLFDPLPTVVRHALPETPAAGAAPTETRRENPTVHAEPSSASEDKPSNLDAPPEPEPEPSDSSAQRSPWFVTAQAGASARSVGNYNFSRDGRLNIQGGVGFGLYLHENIRMELSSALVQDSLEPLRLGVVVDLPIAFLHLHLGARGALVFASGQRSLAVGALAGLALEAFPDIVTGLRIYVGYEPTFSADRMARPDEYVYTATFHTTFHLDS